MSYWSHNHLIHRKEDIEGPSDHRNHRLRNSRREGVGKMFNWLFGGPYTSGIIESGVLDSEGMDQTTKVAQTILWGEELVLDTHIDELKEEIAVLRFRIETEMRHIDERFSTLSTKAKAPTKKETKNAR